MVEVEELSSVNTKSSTTFDTVFSPYCVGINRNKEIKGRYYPCQIVGVLLPTYYVVAEKEKKEI